MCLKLTKIFKSRLIVILCKCGGFYLLVLLVSLLKI